MNSQYDFSLLVVGPLCMLMVLALRRFFDLPTRLPRWNRLLSWLWMPATTAFFITSSFHYRPRLLDDGYVLFAYAVVAITLLQLWRHRPARTVLLALLPLLLHRLLNFVLAVDSLQLVKPYAGYLAGWGKFANIWFLGLVFLARSQKKTLAKEQVIREKEAYARQLIAAQNTELERLVAERTAALTQQAEALRTALEELQTTQTQLIQAEKMASLGELTAGIAHEIQNPLNFVNNFSEVSAELLDELADT
ncbi:MAG: histidine kinase, partial [Cytophagaceae bacterium]